nr:MAG TPA: hypothetical protein [Caudoviricetes sp.]
MKKKTYLFVIDNKVLVDKLKPCRKVSKDLFLVKIDEDNRCVIDYYTRLQLKLKEPLRVLYNDYLVVDKFGTIVTVILTCFKHKNDLIKKSIKKYNTFKKDSDYKTYKLKQLMKYVSYKIKIGEY